jgi:hypothetical protein
MAATRDWLGSRGSPLALASPAEREMGPTLCLQSIVGTL